MNHTASAALLALFVACSADDGKESGDAPTDPGDAPAATVVPCEISTEAGFTTDSFEQNGEERCLTTYVDPDNPSEALPMVMLPDCYTENALQNPNEVMQLARHYNVRTMELSSPTGGWRFPLNNEINAANHGAQCDPESTPEIAYLEAAFAKVDEMVEAGTVDADKIYVSGFSQNSMFSVFAATCFPDRIRGISQGGSGLYSEADGSKALPKCEGACTASDFEEYDDECITEAPCDTCNYFPVLPTSGDDTFQSCLLMYDNDDSAHSTAVPGHTLLTAAGHDATLHIFASNPAQRLGGHSMPVLDWEWANSCLGVNEPCSSMCGEAVVACVNTFKDTFRAENGGADPLADPETRGQLVNAYHECIRTNADRCPRGCAATPPMLESVEVPACVCLPGQADCDCTTSDIPSSCGGI
ncbi:MAG: hypothetical protein VX944_04525 [Myxococcota bacterium]|nr:hypothetical protein [Myxococcota bacterium]